MITPDNLTNNMVTATDLQSRQLRNIREECARFGFDLSHLSDEQLTASIQNLQRACAHAGISVNDAIRAINMFSRNMAPRTSPAGGDQNG